MVNINNVEKLQVQLLQATTAKVCKQKGPNNYSRKQNKENMNKSTMLIWTKQPKMITSISNIQKVTMQGLPWMHTILPKVLPSSQTHPNFPIF